MRIPTSDFIFWIWVFIFLFTACLTAFSFRAGFRGRGTLIGWRIIKLLSSACGALGVLSILINIDASIRKEFLERPTSEQILEYVNLRQKIDRERRRVCQGVSDFDKPSHLPPACLAVVNFEASSQHYSFAAGRRLINFDGSSYPQISAVAIADINTSIDEINSYATADEVKSRPMHVDTKFKLMLLSAMLLAAALAGSVGEAAFQLRQAMDAKK